MSFGFFETEKETAKLSTKSSMLSSADAIATKTRYFDLFDFKKNETVTGKAKIFGQLHNFTTARETKPVAEDLLKGPKIFN